MPVDTLNHATQPPALQAKETKRLDYLDGLRALAALWVVLGHIWMYDNGMAAHSGLLGAVTNGLLYNHLAVDIFIVLSGFCLMLPVMKTKSLTGGALLFYQRRARRILPPFYFSLLVAVLYTMFGQWRQHEAIGFDKSTLLINLTLLQDVFPAANTINGVWWSVALEYKIYFLFPLFIALYFRYGPALTLSVAALIGYGLTAALTAWQPHQEISWVQTAPWYVLLFATGLCACAFASRPAASAQIKTLSLSAAGLFVLIAILLHANPILPSGSHARYLPSLRYIDPIVGAFVAIGLILLHQSASSGNWVHRILGWTPLVRLGAMSYSLYLIHSPVVRAIGKTLDRVHAIKSHFLVEEAILLIVGLPIVIAVSYAFFLVCERPFMKSRPSKAKAPKVVSVPMSLAFREKK